MQSNRFRPQVDGLEDRVVMSVSPGEVVAAFTRTVQFTDQLLDLTEKLGRPRTTENIQFLATRLPQIANQSRADAAVLAEYLASLQSEIAANPSQFNTLAPFAGTIGAKEFEATVNAAYADLYARGFGAPAPVPPTPPPEDSSPDFGVPPGTPSGLPFSLTDPSFQPQADGTQIWDVVVGTGTAVQLNDPVTLNYIGYLTDGTVFDSSFNNGQPLVTTLNTSNLIAGFVSGTIGMQPGGVRRVFIPTSLAYGENPPAGVPENADLVFEITLVSSP